MTIEMCPFVLDKVVDEACRRGAVCYRGLAMPPIAVIRLPCAPDASN